MKTLSVNASVSLPDDCATTRVCLEGFMPVEGRWTCSEPDLLASCIVEAIAIEQANRILSGASDFRFKVELFRSDGRSLDGSDGITEGNLLITRRVGIPEAAAGLFRAMKTNKEAKAAGLL